MARLLQTKSLQAIMGEASETGEHTLARSLGPGSLVALGIGAIIGTGIFGLTGPAAARYAGPGVVYSFILAAVGCVFAGLCYAEFSAMIPVAGSAYTYGYATLGEIFAWIIGWDLTSACACPPSWQERPARSSSCGTATGSFWGAWPASWRRPASTRQLCRSGTVSST
jgi:amino acid permease